MDIKKILAIGFGFFFLVLGAIGIIVPVLPTPPFVLLAAGCFAYGSEKLYIRLCNTRYFGEFIANYRAGVGVSHGTKARALAFLYVMMALSIYMVKIFWVRIVLALIALAVTVHVLMLKKKS